MGMSYILSLIAGIAMTVILGTQVAPSMIEQIKVRKVEATTINNQEVIFEGVKRYITMKQANPTDLEQVITDGFLDDSVKYNGFGGTYEIEINDTKGLLTIETTITDPKVQEMFLKSFKSKFTPKQVGTSDVFKTTFVIPMDVMHGSGLFMSGIPVQTDPPNASEYKFWYDTSGSGKAILKISDGVNWKEVKVEGEGGGEFLAQ